MTTTGTPCVHPAGVRARPTATLPRGAGLPPAGPVWFSTVMGTAILSTLLGQRSAEHPGWAVVPAAALLLLGWALLIGLATAFLVRTARDSSAFTSTVTDPLVVPTWGTVSMGLLALGAATLTVLPQVAPALSGAAVGVDSGLWLAGTLVGLATAIGFGAVLLTRDVGPPRPLWGLAVVPPMVSATTGAALVPSVGSGSGRLALLVVALACFVLALCLGVVVFGRAYHHHVRVSAIPVAASVSAWIPLGVVGQSAAAAQAMASAADHVVAPAAAAGAHDLADAYGWAMMVASVPVVAFAVRVTARGFAARMPFGPGWWALTFPLGTLALGAHLLAGSTGSSLVEVFARAALVTLAGTWSFCAVATLWALRPRPTP